MTTALDNTYEEGLLRNDVKEIAQDLMLTGLLSDSGIRFVLASMRISNALQAIQQEAFEIAETSLLLHHDEEIDRADLSAMGDLVNRLMRLCTVAMFDEEISHAKAALRMEADQRRLATTATIWHRQFDRIPPSEAVFVLSISERLDELIRQTQEMARAIIFWLEDKRDLSPESYGFQAAEYFTASPRSVSEFELDYCI